VIKIVAKFLKQPAKVAASFLVLSWRFLCVFDGDAIMPKWWSKNSFSKRPLLIYELDVLGTGPNLVLDILLSKVKRNIYFVVLPVHFIKHLTLTELRYI